jgi:hypothetical protein
MAPTQGIQVQTAAVATTAPKKPMSLWWPMSFLIAWVLFSALGGGLFSGGIASDVETCYEYDCYESNTGSGMVIGGIACLAISGICGFVFWVLFIVWLVKRSRYRSYAPSTIVYVNNPSAPTNGVPYQVQPLGGVYAEEAQHTYAPAPAPTYQSGVYASDKQGTRQCHQCGAIATTPFCAQCGAQV